MLLGFNTENEVKAKAAMLVYVIYKSRDAKRGPSGLDMWGQIERFAKAAAKRSEGVDDFVDSFKRKMACSTINPYWMRNDASATNATVLKDGSIISFKEDMRIFGIEIFEDGEEGKEIVDCLYRKTQIVVLLVRDRLEREKMFAKEGGGNEDRNDLYAGTATFPYRRK